MADLSTTPDIVNYVLKGMNEPTDGTSVFQSDVLDQVNHIYRLMYAGGGELNASEKRKPMAPPWARSQYPLVVNLEPPISVGTINVTNNSATVTFSSAPANSVAGFQLKVRGEPEVYRIAAHTGGNATATLDANYVGDTNAVALYDVFKLRYSLGSDVLGIVTPFRVFSNSQRGTDNRRQIDVIDETQFDARYPLALIRNEFPSHAKIVYSDPSGSNNTIDVVFNSWNSDRERIEIPYVRIPVALTLSGSNPIMPIQWRPVLAEYALLFMLRDADDDRAPGQAQIAKGKFEAIVSETQGLSRSANFQYGRIYPRQDIAYRQDFIVQTEDGFILTG